MLRFGAATEYIEQAVVDKLQQYIVTPLRNSLLFTRFLVLALALSLSPAQPSPLALSLSFGALNFALLVFLRSYFRAP
jgi:fatty acid desaturase